MAKPNPEYELILMLDPEVPDERRDAIAVEARRRIDEGAELRQERSWGLRKMAYEIERRTEADYRFFRFADGAGVLDDLSHSLRIADGVLRFRIFKVDPRAPVVDPPPPVALAAAASARPGSRRRDDDRPPRAPDPAAAPEGSSEESPQPAEEQASAPEVEPASKAPAAAAPAAAEAEPAAPAESVPAADAPDAAGAPPSEPESGSESDDS